MIPSRAGHYWVQGEGRRGLKVTSHKVDHFAADFVFKFTKLTQSDGVVDAKVDQVVKISDGLQDRRKRVS